METKENAYLNYFIQSNIYLIKNYLLKQIALCENLIYFDATKCFFTIPKPFILDKSINNFFDAKR